MQVQVQVQARARAVGQQAQQTPGATGSATTGAGSTTGSTTWRRSHFGNKRGRRRNHWRDMRRSLFNQCHRLFRHRQGQPWLSRRRQRQFRRYRHFRLRLRLRLNRLQHRLGNRQHNRCRLFFYSRSRLRRRLRNRGRLFDDGFLRFLTQPSEQAFLLASRSWGLLVVVGTKHGGRLSHGSDAP